MKFIVEPENSSNAEFCIIPCKNLGCIPLAPIVGCPTAACPFCDEKCDSNQ